MGVQIAPIHTDPMLQVASGPFGTWTGIIHVEESGDLLVLSRSGDENRIPAMPAEQLRECALAVADQTGAVLEPGTEAWIQLRHLYPMMHKLVPVEAYDVVQRMAPPRMEFVDAGGVTRPITLWAALVGDQPGWFGGVLLPS